VNVLGWRLRAVLSSVYFGGRVIPTLRRTLTMVQHVTHERSNLRAILQGVTSQKTVTISNGFDYHSAGRPTSYATLPSDGKLFSCLFCSPSTYTTRLTTRRIRQSNDPVAFHSMPRDLKSENTRATQCPFYRVPGQGTVVKWKACNRRASRDSCNVQENYKKIHPV
jgi:hypothetical protein